MARRRRQLNRKAIYPGTFDPIHFGHIDIAIRAAHIFDELVVAIYQRPNKETTFSAQERVAMAKQAFANHKNIYVKPYHGLTVEFARRVDAQAIVRGLRVISDFELEYQMSHTNRQLAPEIEFICLMTHQEYAFVSSSIVKEVFRLAGDISKMAPAYVTQALQAKIDTEKEGPKSAPLVSLRD